MSHQLGLIHNDGTESQWPGIPTSRHPQSPEWKSAETRCSRRSDMLIFDVDDFTAYQVAIHFSLPQSHLYNSTKAYPFSKCQNAKVSLDFQQPGQSAVNNDHIECKKQHLSASLFVADFGNSLHSARAPWIHQKPHLGGSVHPMLFEAPNESFDPPNGQGKGQELLTGGASLAQTAPAPYLGHVALPARLKKLMSLSVHFVLVPVIACHQMLFLFLSLLDSTNTEIWAKTSRASPQSSSVRQPKSLRINKRAYTQKAQGLTLQLSSVEVSHLLISCNSIVPNAVANGSFSRIDLATPETPWKAMNFTRRAAPFEKH